MNVRILTALAAALALSACAATDDSTGQQPNAKERAAATSLVGQLRALDTMSVRPSEAPQVLAASRFAPLVSLLAADGTSIALPRRDHAGDLRPCLTQTSDTVVYTDCEIGEHVVEGSMSGLGERVKADLVDVFVINPENHGAVTIKATLNASGDEINGTLEVDVMWTAGNTDSTADASVRFTDVVLDSQGCAISGSISVKGHVGDQSDSSRTLQFGPNCGDLRVAR